MFRSGVPVIGKGANDKEKARRSGLQHRNIWSPILQGVIWYTYPSGEARIWAATFTGWFQAWDPQKMECK